MNPNGNGTRPSDLNPFGTPTRMIVLGYYDGPTDGLLQFGDGGPVFRFVVPDEEIQLSRNATQREYAFSAMPPDAFDRLEFILAEHLKPSNPGWYANWQFATPEIEREVESRVAAVLSEAGPVAWIVIGRIWPLDDFRPTRVVALQPA